MKLGRERSVYEYYRQVKQFQIGEFFREKGDKYIAQVDTDELVAYLHEQYALPQIEIDPKKEAETERSSEIVEYRDAFGDYRKGERSLIICTIYFLPHHNLEMALALQPSRYTMTHLEVEYNHRTSSITFKTPPNRLNEDIEYIQEMIKTKNPEIEQENNILRDTIRTHLKTRKETISRNEKQFEDAISKVSIPLKRKDISETPLVDLTVRKSIQALREPLVNPRKEFTLDRAYVLEILEIVKRSGMQFELTPQVFAKHGEEDLRSIILSHLNVVFEGSATGETFNKLGKTDIHLNIAQGQIFVAECKFWSGVKAYRDEHIDQLFRYLTWRRNYGAIITFSKNKGFTRVLSELENAVKKHPTYLKGFIKLQDTHFQSTHSFPEDDEKEIEIHHLIFNLYS